jgi:uracil-DNA glycosylase
MRTFTGGKPGRSTQVMRDNCGAHFRATLNILEPTLIVAQGKGVRRWIGRLYGLGEQSGSDPIETLPLATGPVRLVSFSHPSAHGELNWGMNERTPYLVNRVAPTIAPAVERRAD